MVIMQTVIVTSAIAVDNDHTRTVVPGGMLSIGPLMSNAVRTIADIKAQRLVYKEG